MAAASVTKSAQHVVEALVLGTNITSVAGTVTATIPTAAAGAVGSVSATITGVALGDIVIVSGPTVALTGIGTVHATVTAADTINLSAGSTAGYTGAARTFNYVVLKQS